MKLIRRNRLVLSGSDPRVDNVAVTPSANFLADGSLTVPSDDHVDIEHSCSPAFVDSLTGLLTAVGEHRQGAGPRTASAGLSN
jgi:hypothetical protein